MPHSKAWHGVCTCIIGATSTERTLQHEQDPPHYLHFFSATCFNCKVWHYHGTSALLEPKQRFCQSRVFCAFYDSSRKYLSFNWSTPFSIYWVYSTVVLFKWNTVESKMRMNTKGSILLLSPLLLTILLSVHGSKALLSTGACRQRRPRNSLPNFLRYTS